MDQVSFGVMGEFWNSASMQAKTYRLAEVLSRVLHLSGLQFSVVFLCIFLQRTRDQALGLFGRQSLGSVRI